MNLIVDFLLSAYWQCPSLRSHYMLHFPSNHANVLDHEDLPFATWDKEPAPPSHRSLHYTDIGWNACVRDSG